MIRLIFAAFLLSAAWPAAAEEAVNDYEKSLLFKDRSNPYQELNKGTTAAQDQDAYCQDLSRQIDESRGRPQRRSSLNRRYEAECMTRNGPRERSSLKESNRLQP
jgi:hypothetical protein